MAILSRSGFVPISDLSWSLFSPYFRKKVFIFGLFSIEARVVITATTTAATTTTSGLFQAFSHSPFFFSEEISEENWKEREAKTLDSIIQAKQRVAEEIMQMNERLKKQKGAIQLIKDEIVKVEQLQDVKT